jgi:queuosine precursor transporter
MKIKENKRNVLFFALGSFFIANAIIAEFIGVKIFSLEESLGFQPLNLKLFGDAYSFNMTAGVLLWPVVFIMTDIINEYFGRHGVKLFSWIAAVLIAYAFIAMFFAIQLVPAAFWINKETSMGTLNMQLAYSQVLGQGLWIIIASLIAFLLGQAVDVYVFHYVKMKTGDKALWLRATGSTLVSQLIDSFVVLFIAFYIGAGWSLQLVISICIVNYLYKVAVALLLTPLLYLLHKGIDNYLGKDLSRKMIDEAASDW